MKELTTVKAQIFQEHDNIKVLALVRALQNGNDTTRVEVAKALGQYKALPDIDNQVLAVILQDENEHVRYAVAIHAV